MKIANPLVLDLTLFSILRQHRGVKQENIKFENLKRAVSTNEKIRSKNHVPPVVLVELSSVSVGSDLIITQGLVQQPEKNRFIVRDVVDVH